MKLEMLEIVSDLGRNSKYWLRINNNDKKDIKLNKKEVIKIRKLMEKGNKFFGGMYSTIDKNLKKKFIDFIANKTKRRKK